VLSDDLDPILIQVTVPLPLAMILSAFTDANHLTQWMCDGAQVVAEVGGAYEVSWNSDPAFTSHGTITELHPELDVGFTWEAPPPHGAVMNQPTPTKVYVRLQDSPEGVDVTLEHSGWKSGPAWEEARSWHFQLWDDRLHRLRPYLMKVAYG
jgi:uncharacterized protein YndB with AHSA1/START domain